MDIIIIAPHQLAHIVTEMVLLIGVHRVETPQVIFVQKIGDYQVGDKLMISVQLHLLVNIRICIAITII